MDYERRKAKKMQEKMSLLPPEKLKELAERDPCSREVYERVYEEEKIKWQQENVAKLRMPPCPDIS